MNNGTQKIVLRTYRTSLDIIGDLLGIISRLEPIVSFHFKENESDISRVDVICKDGSCWYITRSGETWTASQVTKGTI